MCNLNVPKNYVMATLLKICRCNKNIHNVVVTKKQHSDKEKWKLTAKLFMHVIQKYHKKRYRNVVKNMLL